LVFLSVAALPQNAVLAQAGSSIAESYRADADRLIDAAVHDTSGYARLGALVDGFGHRLSGSTSLEKAIDWILAEMRRDGLANVRGEPVMVPHWERGKESATLVSPRPLALHMLGLGGSVGTPTGGIAAPVLVVRDFADLDRRAAEVKGKIVLFDYPFPTDKPPFEAYGDAVAYRGRGASAAAKLGAVASLIRSVASFSIQSPHTGALRYDSTTRKIPAAALSVEDAQMLHRMQDRGEKIVVRLEMAARTLPDAPSRNAVAELVGRERPDEVVVLGGHIDSWDVGQGAMDDGAGSVAAWEAVRLMKVLGLRPRRTVRVVLWTNEENGGRGGRGYRDAHAAELTKHVAAMESDAGIFRPNGFRFVGSDSALAIAQQIGALLVRVGSTSVAHGGGEADIGPLIQAGVPGFGLDVDGSRYFWYHHSQGDMLNVIDRGDFQRCVATMAVMAYVLADLPEPLPRGARDGTR
jgi:carboxypeptidase Q